MTANPDAALEAATIRVHTLVNEISDLDRQLNDLRADFVRRATELTSARDDLERQRDAEMARIDALIEAGGLSE